MQIGRRGISLVGLRLTHALHTRTIRIFEVWLTRLILRGLQDGA